MTNKLKQYPKTWEKFKKWFITNDYILPLLSHEESKIHKESFHFIEFEHYSFEFQEGVYRKFLIENGFVGVYVRAYNIKGVN